MATNTWCRNLEHEGLNLSWMHIDYLGCQDCDRLRAENPDDDLGRCDAPKEGCKILLAMLEKA